MKKLVIILVIGILTTAKYLTVLAQEPEEETAQTTVVTKDEYKDDANAKDDKKKAENDFLLDYQKFRKSADAKFESNEIRLDDLKIEIFSMKIKDKSAIYQQ